MRAAFVVAGLLLVVLLLWFGDALFSTEDGAGVAQLSPGSSAEARALDPLVAEAREVRRDTSALEPAEEEPPAAAPAESASAASDPSAPTVRSDDLRLRVVDGTTREPLAGIDVRVSWVVESGGARSMTGISVQRTADPAREVRVPRALVEKRRESRGEMGQILVHAYGIFPRALELRLKADPWPTEIQDLVLPPHGFVELEVQDELGQRLEVDGNLTLRPTGAEGWTNTQVLAVNRGLSAPRLCGLDVSFDVVGELGDGSKIEGSMLRGPLVAGELRRHVVRRAQVGSRLAVRVLLAPDQPLRSASVELSIEERRRIGSSTGASGSMTTERTDAEGWLRFVLEDPQRGVDLQRHLEIGYVHAQRGRLAAFLEASGTYPPGETSLGEVVLGEPKVFAAGVVVKRGGKPLLGAEVRAEPIDAEGEEIGLGSMQAKTDAQGRFSLRSSRPVTRARVIADRKGYAASMPIDVLPGSSGLAIELEAAASLRGSVVLPQGIEPRSVRVGVEFPHATRCATADTAVQADGSFFVEEIAPDTGHVVFFPSRGRELARIPDVNFISGEENRDPRLQSLELCRGWRELSLRLLDPSGKALGACDLELLLAGDRRGYPLRTDLDGQVGEWFPPEASHFELRVRGYRSLSFEWVQRTMELQLRAGIRVVLPIEAPKVEPIARLKVALAASNGARTAQVDVIDGLAELVVSEPGTYEVQPAFVILQESAMMVSGFQLEPRVHVEVGEGDQQRLPVCRIDEAALRAALKAR